MKPLGLFLVAAGLLAAGACSDSVARLPEPEHSAATYKAGHGIRLTAQARGFVGLETAEYQGRLPGAALLRTAKGDFVYVANGDWFLRTPISVTGEGSAGFNVTDGLYEGDIVVIRGVRPLWLAELQAINGGVGCADDH
jgi:hypothetical protein